MFFTKRATACHVSRQPWVSETLPPPQQLAPVLHGDRMENVDTKYCDWKIRNQALTCKPWSNVQVIKTLLYHYISFVLLFVLFFEYVFVKEIFMCTDSLRVAFFIHKTYQDLELVFLQQLQVFTVTFLPLLRTAGGLSC